MGQMRCNVLIVRIVTIMMIGYFHLLKVNRLIWVTENHRQIVCILTVSVYFCQSISFVQLTITNATRAFVSRPSTCVMVSLSVNTGKMNKGVVR